ncbi:hypothetical protein [Cupriavidus sp. SW-Y-13]|uniref:hypothetical protein n=1 Tax=Cupriavidus sp. SW-Y-13 TaxID=2653854 RepID=UPI00136559EE|nr:hypothetical protein [Cupriavidus sp. SW-Y-13]MWL91262.1 hypothetical protein [Cupriavidus sp. SW-Y-13]
MGLSKQEAVSLLIEAANVGVDVDIRKGAIAGLGYAGGHDARGTLAAIAVNLSARADLRAAALAALGMASQRDF